MTFRAHWLGSAGCPPSPRDPLISITPVLRYKHVPPYLGFLDGFWRSNSDPQKPLPTESFPGPPVFIYTVTWHYMWNTSFLMTAAQYSMVQGSLSCHLTDRHFGVLVLQKTGWWPLLFCYMLCGHRRGHLYPEPELPGTCTFHFNSPADSSD